MPKWLAQLILWLLTASAASLGLWATFAPRSFYDNFPGFQHWVVSDGPYNHHLVTDVGGLNLALAFVTAMAAVVLSRQLIVAASGAWLLYGIPHITYHLRHLDVLSGSDKVTSITSLAMGIAGPIVLLVWPVAHERARVREEVSG